MIAGSTPPQDHHVVSEDRLLPLRSERVALDRSDQAITMFGPHGERLHLHS